MAEVSISAYSGVYEHSADNIIAVQKSGADYLHVDIMDGKFVSGTGLPISWIDDYSEMIDIPVDVHLMCKNNREYIKYLKNSKISKIVFHVEPESTKDTLDLLSEIHVMGKKSGLAFSPETSLEKMSPFISYIDEILLLSIQPGTKATCFLPDTYKRIEKARAMVESADNDIGISVDGFVRLQNIEKCVECGATKLIIGRDFFSKKNKEEYVNEVHLMKNSQIVKIR